MIVLVIILCTFFLIRLLGWLGDQRAIRQAEEEEEEKRIIKVREENRIRIEKEERKNETKEQRQRREIREKKNREMSILNYVRRRIDVRLVGHHVL